MKPLQFLRSIPFGLVFLAFLLPLFVISCPGTDTVLAQGSVYQSLDLANILGGIMGQMSSDQVNDVNSSMKLFTVVIFALMILSAMGFGLAFFKRKVAAVMGIVALVLMVAIVGVLVSKSSEVISVSPGSGAIISIVLYLAAIVMNFIPAKAEKQLSSAAKILLVAIPTALVVIGFTISLVSSNNQAKDATQAMENLFQGMDNLDDL